MLIANVALTITFFLFLWSHDRERRRWDEERGRLLNRIQAPEVAMSIESLPDPPEKPYVGFEDDQAWNELQRASR